MISHLTIGTNDVSAARRFYDAVLGALGIRRVQDYGDEAMAYARSEDERPRVYVMLPFDGGPATFGNGTHIAFLAETRAAVDAFHRAALAEGGTDEGAPGPRPQYGDNYYGAYVRDRDGNKLQAVCYAVE